MEGFAWRVLSLGFEKATCSTLGSDYQQYMECGVNRDLALSVDRGTRTVLRLRGRSRSFTVFLKLNSMVQGPYTGPRKKLRPQESLLPAVVLSC